MKIGIGADRNALEFKNELKQFIKGLGYEVVDFEFCENENVEYPEIAFEVGMAINKKDIDRGILCCGTGIGMAIAANKVPGIRAAQIVDTYSAQRAQLSNDANIVTFGSFVQGVESAKLLTKEYLDNSFQTGTPSEKKIQQIIDFEKKVKMRD